MPHLSEIAWCRVPTYIPGVYMPFDTGIIQVLGCACWLAAQPSTSQCLPSAWSLPRSARAEAGRTDLYRFFIAAFAFCLEHANPVFDMLTPFEQGGA